MDPNSREFPIWVFVALLGAGLMGIGSRMIAERLGAGAWLSPTHYDRLIWLMFAVGVSTTIIPPAVSVFCATKRWLVQRRDQTGRSK